MNDSPHRMKMLAHLREMEVTIASIERMEASALEHARSGRLRRAGIRGRTPDEYHAKRALEDNFWYQQLLGKRDGHMRAVQIYALVALVESGQPVGTIHQSWEMYPPPQETG